MQVDILLATYNGEKYLREQIDSILGQTHQNFRLLIRDDCSSDKTPVIIKEYVEKYPEKIFCLTSDERLGVKSNFSRLLNQSSADYICFADQDDVWFSNKIELTLNELLHLEIENSKHCPILVHTDLEVVDEHLRTLHPSFWTYSNIFPKKSRTLNRLLVQNVITGCTVMINRSLAKLIKPVPSETIMHDWWMGLVASTFGIVREIPRSTLFYRQHSQNTLGAKRFGSFRYIKDGVRKLARGNEIKRVQAHVFYERYKGALPTSQEQMVQKYICMDKMPLWKSRYYIFRHQLFKNGVLRNLATFAFQRVP